LKAILITGANGFIGKNLIEHLNLTNPDYKIKAISRFGNKSNILSYNDFINDKYSSEFFEDITDVVHLAAVAHKFENLNFEEINKLNIEYPIKLINILKNKSLEKFIFMSSIGVTLIDQGIFLDTKAYAESKKKAEEKLIEAVVKTKAKVISLRAPMVYGKNAPGNFKKLLKLLSFPILIPFGSMDFEKPVIHVTNLVSAISSVIKADKNNCKSGVYEISDPFALKFNNFLINLNSSISGNAIIIPFPLKILQVLFLIIGKNNLYRKLILSFKISNNKFDNDFNWPKLVDRDNMFDDIKNRNE
jgi:nucleoside-diphosphate-sugar epimerase